jgi:hypothetical protein
MIEKAKWVTFFRRQSDGSMKAVADMYNADGLYEGRETQNFPDPTSLDPCRTALAFSRLDFEVYEF